MHSFGDACISVRDIEVHLHISLLLCEKGLKSESRFSNKFYHFSSRHFIHLNVFQIHLI